MAEETIQCWKCKSDLTLTERGDNDGDCLYCGAEIDLDDYLAKALADNRALRAQLPSQGGEAVAWRVGFELYRTYEGALANVRNPDLKPEPLYTHPADQVAEGVVVSRELHLRSLDMLSNYVTTLAGMDFPDNDEGDYRYRLNGSERARVNRAIKELRALLEVKP